MRGPALKQSNRSQCVNDTDFYTLEPITELEYDDFFSYKDTKGFIYGFSLKSLTLMLNIEGSIINPYNRNTFEETTIRDIKLLINKPKAKSTTEFEVEVFEKMNALRNDTIDARIENLFYEIDRLGNYTSSSWFSQLTREQYIRLFKRIRELWNYRAQIEDTVKLVICPFFDPFNFRLNRYLGSIDSVRERNLTHDECKKICVVTFENLIYSGRDDTYKNLIVIHILSALTLVSIEAREALPWLYDSIVYLINL